MAPRIPLMTRKGGPADKPALMIALRMKPKSPMDGPQNDTDQGAADSNDPADDVTCPNCGCMFDASTGEIDAQGKPGQVPPEAVPGTRDRTIARALAGVQQLHAAEQQAPLASAG